MTRTIFNTACTIDGFIADEQDRLDWLFAVDGADDAEAGFAAFLDGIGAIIMGSTTYEWILAQEQLMEHPERWAATYGDRPTVVLSSRALPLVPGAPLRIVAADVADLWPSLRDSAGGRDVWIVGGGDLAGRAWPDAETALAQVRSLPKPALVRPPPTRQTIGKDV